MNKTEAWSKYETRPLRRATPRTYSHFNPSNRFEEARIALLAETAQPRANRFMARARQEAKEAEASVTAEETRVVVAVTTASPIERAEAAIQNAAASRDTSFQRLQQAVDSGMATDDGRRKIGVEWAVAKNRIVAADAAVEADPVARPQSPMMP